ncbi:MAG: hypothetical protein ACKVWR_00950 [Acidimicrobiales bacterium]
MNARPGRVTGVVATAEPRRLLVTFEGGVRACYGLDRVAVSETDETVTVTVYVGERPPGPRPRMLIAKQYSATVELSEPLGERTVVDGSQSHGGVPTVPAAYAQAAFDAWAAADTGRLDRLASDAVVDL